MSCAQNFVFVELDPFDPSDAVPPVPTFEPDSPELPPTAAPAPSTDTQLLSIVDPDAVSTPKQKPTDYVHQPLSIVSTPRSNPVGDHL